MRFRLRTLMIVLALGPPVLAYAQPPNRGLRLPEFPFDGPSFLKLPLAERGPQNRLITAAANRSVQKELGVSDEVSKILTSLREEFPANAQARYADAGINVNKGRFSNLESQTIRVIQSQLILQALDQIERLLSPEQFVRLKQIRVQWYGIGALRLTDVATELKLTDDQLTKVNNLVSDFTRQMNAGLPKKGEDVVAESKDRSAKIAELRKEEESQVLKVLTAEQQTQFVAMKGAPFDLRELNNDELRAAGMLASPPQGPPAK